MTLEPQSFLKAGDALLIVDVQKDFCPGGALQVPDGDAVVPVLNRLSEAACDAGVPVYASRDWHPQNHVSFQPEGGPWPVHCVQDTDGAAFHPDLRLPEGAIVVSKGTRFDQDQYSAFDQTGFEQELKRRGVTRVIIGGLAEDVCVQGTAHDARKHGFEVQVLREASRAITEEGKRKTEHDLAEAGVELM